LREELRQLADLWLLVRAPRPSQQGNKPSRDRDNTLSAEAAALVQQRIGDVASELVDMLHLVFPPAPPGQPAAALDLLANASAVDLEAAAVGQWAAVGKPAAGGLAAAGPSDAASDSAREAKQGSDDQERLQHHLQANGMVTATVLPYHLFTNALLGAGRSLPAQLLIADLPYTGEGSLQGVEDAEALRTEADKVVSENGVALIFCTAQQGRYLYDVFPKTRLPHASHVGQQTGPTCTHLTVPSLWKMDDNPLIFFRDQQFNAANLRPGVRQNNFECVFIATRRPLNPKCSSTDKYRKTNVAWTTDPSSQFYKQSVEAVELAKLMPYKKGKKGKLAKIRQHRRPGVGAAMFEHARPSIDYTRHRFENPRGCSTTEEHARSSVRSYVPSSKWERLRREDGTPFRPNAEKPVKMLRYLISTYSNPGDQVIDLFAGTGTSGLAALSLNRRWAGCDVDQDCFTAGIARMYSALSASSRGLEGQLDLSMIGQKSQERAADLQLSLILASVEPDSVLGRNDGRIDTFPASWRLGKFPESQAAACAKLGLELKTSPALLKWRLSEFGDANDTRNNGLFAQRDFKKDDVVCGFFGTLVLTTPKEQQPDDMVMRNKVFVKLGIGIRAHQFCPGQAINDYKNLGEQNVDYVEALFPETVPSCQWVEVVARCPIQKGQEIFADYGALYTSVCEEDLSVSEAEEGDEDEDEGSSAEEEEPLQPKKRSTRKRKNPPAADDEEEEEDEDAQRLPKSRGKKAKVT
jgi:hypothetical protein